MLDSWTIIIKQNKKFQGRMHPGKFQLDKIQYVLLSAII